ncbi:MAG TPA: hypothetical protein VMQ60_10470 [Acidobacteriaceae bacterium]|jgi:hypothetical protein|nr:hypothetical protein [Acidobacteriaceae bacterium]
MALRQDLGKVAARPSQEAIEPAGDDSINEFKSDEKKMDNVTMRGAKRGANRYADNEEKIPGSTIFSK